MNVQFKNSFAQDLKKIKDKGLKERVARLITTVEQAQNLQTIEHIKKLKGGDGYYRIRLGDYRVGLIVQNDTVIFVRFLHRKDIYRYFP